MRCTLICVQVYHALLPLQICVIMCKLAGACTYVQYSFAQFAWAISANVLGNLTGKSEMKLSSTKAYKSYKSLIVRQLKRASKSMIPLRTCLTDGKRNAHRLM